jgi:hypothetical protein
VGACLFTSIHSSQEGLEFTDLEFTALNDQAEQHYTDQMSRPPRPESNKGAKRFWYVCVLKSRSVERCTGTRPQDDGYSLRSMTSACLNFSARKSEIVDRWEQARRVAKAGEQRAREALLRISPSRAKGRL